jgi:DNA-directed RNA polymerase subunit M/transcription elongation factor TFIIS
MSSHIDPRLSNTHYIEMLKKDYPDIYSKYKDIIPPQHLIYHQAARTQVDLQSLQRSTSPVPDFSRAQVSPSPPRVVSPAPGYDPPPSYGMSSKINSQMRWLLTKLDYGTLTFHFCNKCRNNLFEDENKIIIEDNGVVIKIMLCHDCANTEVNSRLYFHKYYQKLKKSHADVPSSFSHTHSNQALDTRGQKRSLKKEEQIMLDDLPYVKKFC